MHPHYVAYLEFPDGTLKRPQLPDRKGNHRPLRPTRFLTPALARIDLGIWPTVDTLSRPWVAVVVFRLDVAGGYFIRDARLVLRLPRESFA